MSNQNRGKTVLDLMSTPVYVVNPGDTVSHARLTMLRKNISKLVVVDDKNKPVGIITKRDIAEAGAQKEPPTKRRPIGSQPVSRYMSKNLVTASPNTALKTIAKKMLKHGISGIPITENKQEQFKKEGGLLGIITKKDLTRHFAEQKLFPETTINNVYSPQVHSVHRHTSLNKVVEKMLNQNIHRIIVKENNGTPVGIITKSDLAFTDHSSTDPGIRQKEIKLARKSSKNGNKKLRSIEKVNLVAEDAMTPNLITINKNQPIHEAAEKMGEQDITGLPILENKELAGIITQTDIIKTLTKT